jgi:hypothetical protein
LNMAEPSVKRARRIDGASASEKTGLSSRNNADTRAGGQARKSEKSDLTKRKGSRSRSRDRDLKKRDRDDRGNKDRSRRERDESRGVKRRFSPFLPFSAALTVVKVTHVGDRYLQLVVLVLLYGSVHLPKDHVQGQEIETVIATETEAGTAIEVGEHEISRLMGHQRLFHHKDLKVKLMEIQKRKIQQ